MNLKVAELYHIYFGLRELSNTAMSVKVAYSIAKNKKMLLNELNIFDEMKTEIIDENEQIIDKEKYIETQETEVDNIDLLKIDINDITSDVTPGIIELILPILEITEDK